MKPLEQAIHQSVALPSLGSFGERAVQNLASLAAHFTFLLSELSENFRKFALAKTAETIKLCLAT